MACSNAVFFGFILLRFWGINFWDFSFLPIKIKSEWNLICGIDGIEHMPVVVLNLFGLRTPHKKQWCTSIVSLWAV